jgi:hypothetical protein
MRTKTLICTAILSISVGGGVAFAQDTQTTPTGADPTTTPTSGDPNATTPSGGTSPMGANYGGENSSGNFLERYGLSLSVGGGVVGFTDKAMRDTAKTGGLWDVRVGFLTNTWLGVELAYEGGLQNIDALGLNSDARLLSTAVEADARVNFTQGHWNWQPYAFAGVGWKRYELNNVSTNLSSVNDQDDLVEVPLGLGLGTRYAGWLVDVRGSFRPAFDNDLVPTNNSGDHAAMHTWAAALRLGYAF